MKIRMNYSLFLMLFLIGLFGDQLQTLGLTFFKYYDEILALLPVSFLVFITKGKIRFSKREKKLIAALAIYVFCGILSGLVYHYQSGIAVWLDIFICLKFWLILLTGTWLFGNLDLDRDGKKLFKVVSSIGWIIIVLFAVDTFLHIFPSTYIRYGVRSVSLFWANPSTCSTNILLMMAMMLALGKEKQDRTKLVLEILLLSIVVVFSFRTKAIVSLTVFWLLYVYLVKGKKKVGWETIVIIVSLGIYMAWDRIYYYFFSSIQNDSARYQLLVTSVKIAKERFPLGSGFATFGTHMAAINYSNLYRVYGINTVNGLQEGGAFLGDSFWPAIIGESGVIGTIAFCIFLLLIFQKLQKLKNYNTYVYMCGIYLFIHVMILSSSESAFFNPNTALIALWIGVIINKDVKKPEILGFL